MYYFYCPYCGYEYKVKSIPIPKMTIPNIRDGFGTPIYHYECPQCSNLDAGFMKFGIGRNGELSEEEQIKYFKSVISYYQGIRGFAKNKPSDSGKTESRSKLKILIITDDQGEWLLKIGHSMCQVKILNSSDGIHCENPMFVVDILSDIARERPMQRYSHVIIDKPVGKVFEDSVIRPLISNPVIHTSRYGRGY